ncbi:Death-associated protein kinase related [Orchesella cincta]|uniref:Death-associated protein kinase related n=1 Tax=Orchesella cincta TaxID=48709 RepID=A0A1D2MXG5_ORCCI|nr:Death-associated protein kinase related [Orchesella cincta]
MEKTGLLPLTEEERTMLLDTIPIETDYSVESQPFARGKFAAVRRAFRKNDETVFAAKYIRKRRRTSPEEVWHEVSVLHKSRECPFIVCLYQVFETPLDTVLLLEMAEGGDLQTVLDTEEFLKERVCIDILRDTLQGLKFLHTHSIAHLDIKPQNLVVTGPLPGGRVKLCDFGLSRHLSNTTEVRELLGTPEYVSPEVLNYEPLTLATDCWAVGVLTYVLLTGVSPFGGDSKQETFLNISQRALTFPSNYFQNVSSLAVDFIEKLLVIKPSERLTADECLRHIWLEGSGETDSENPSPQEPNNNEKQRNSSGSPTGDESKKSNGTTKETERHQVSSSGDQRGPNDDIDSGIGSEEDHRRNLSWARLDEVLENERKISTNPDWLTLEVEEDPSRNIWPNRKKKCSWEAECTGSVLRALDLLERTRGGVTTQANLLRTYGRRSQVISKEEVGEGQVVIREFRQLPSAPALLTKHSELTCDSISTRINKLFN